MAKMIDGKRACDRCQERPFVDTVTIGFTDCGDWCGECINGLYEYAKIKGYA